MEQSKNIIGNELFERIKELSQKEFEASLDTCQRVAITPATVTDGELLDALFTLSSRLDLANPLLPVTNEILQRYMKIVGMEQTPRGIEYAWFEKPDPYANVKAAVDKLGREGHLETTR